MRHEGKSLFECVRCPMCACRQLPPYGNFTVGLDYAFNYTIDARKVTDNLGETITLPEAVFLSYFENLGEAITSFSPMHSDMTEYHLYLVLRGDICSLEEIKAYAKTMNVSYLQAKRALTQKRNLIMAGRAYDIWKMLVRLEPFNVHHEIEPEYPYIWIKDEQDT